ncbi:hypothetical protein HDU84_007707, partial [Entophlyctis sp. JEL0112]
LIRGFIFESNALSKEQKAVVETKRFGELSVEFFETLIEFSISSHSAFLNSVLLQSLGQYPLKDAAMDAASAIYELFEAQRF